MLKKMISLLLVVALTATVAIGGTLAYMTDRDGEANVFTVGDVSIKLDENFQQGAKLFPGVDVEKEAFITNTGDNDAWVWMTMAIPAALDDTDLNTVGETNVLHWNVPGVVWKGYGDNTNWATTEKVNAAKANGFITDDHIGDNGLVKPECLWTICQTADDPVEIRQEEIDGVNYNVYTFLYNGKLAPNEQTPVALHKVYLDAGLDIDTDGQWNVIKDGVATEVNWNSNTDGAPIVYVSAYAMQAEGFGSVEEAYNAYNEQWGDNGTEYGAPGTLVSSADELAAALADGGDAILTDNIEATAPITLDGGTLNGGGNTIDSDYEGTSEWGQYAVTVSNGGTVENVKIVDAFRGIGSTNTTEDIYIDNVTVDNVTYAINGNGNNEASVYVTNSTIYGWISYADIDLLSFENCTIGKGNSYDGYMVVYGDTAFNDVTFTTFDMCADDSVKAGSTVTFTNCTNDGTKVTADNFKTLFMYPGDDTDFNKLQACTIIVDGVTVTW